MLRILVALALGAAILLASAVWAGTVIQTKVGTTATSYLGAVPGNAGVNPNANPYEVPNPSTSGDYQAA